MIKHLALIALLALSACEQYPLGMSEEQWNALSPAEQQQAITKQQQQDEFARQQQAAMQYQAEQQQLADQRNRLEYNTRQRLGIVDSEWAQMPPAQKLALRQEQEAIERQLQLQQQPVAVVPVMQ